MRVGLNLSSIYNSQPLRNNNCCGQKPSFKNTNSDIQTTTQTDDKTDYKKLYYTLLNVVALQQNPSLMGK